eukprot:5824370-Prymnesium_polylepis.1
MLLLSSLISGVALQPPLRQVAGGGGLVGHMRMLPGAVLIIDGNNVRGADCFGTSQQELCETVATWAADHSVPAVLMLDHGTEQCACRSGTGTVVTFAGPGQTADDLIVRDSLWLRSEQQTPVFVVTSDAGLIARTKQYRSAQCAGLQMVPSVTFSKLLLGDRSNSADRAARPVRRSAKDREAEKARRKETTAMREHAAAALCEILR